MQLWVARVHFQLLYDYLQFHVFVLQIPKFGEVFLRKKEDFCVVFVCDQPGKRIASYAIVTCSKANNVAFYCFFKQIGD